MEETFVKKAAVRLRVQLMWTGFVAGAIFLLVSAGFAFHRIEFLRHSVRTTGTVIQLISRTDSHGATTYTPVFEFRDRQGHSYETATSFSSSPPLYVVGQTVPVLYEPEQPQTAMPDSFWILWFFSLIFFVFGASLISGSFLLRHLIRRRRSLELAAEKS